ncbi:MAG: glucans biosynthesis glucosyltransferase MdoH [Pseudomonadota bacterium]
MEFALPPEHTLVMPRQSLHAAQQARRGGSTISFWLQTQIARILLLAGTAVVSAYGIQEMHGVLTGDLTVIQWVFLVLFSINFIWISFAGCQAVLGFFLRIKQDIFGYRPIHKDVPGIRTAVLAPVYNEDPSRVAAGIIAMAEGLASSAPGQFAFFILSDTTNPAAWMREEQAFHHLIKDAPAACPIYYRHRRHNTERKAGNIADWVQRWGGAYEAMLVLDADSIMDPSTMIEMARRMEANPGLGLLQTLPGIVMAETLFGRLQQFANRLYGPIFANGLAAWHGNGSNFWGHNAIIRTAAFAQAAHLPVLKGKPPFGGHVISHDFIEAALLQRAGWGVRFDTDLPLTFEEAPPSVSDVLVRDRRWCQGNLQHGRFLFARGFTTTSRLHITSGIMAYMSALFWFLLLAVGVILAVQASFTPTEYFPEPSLFPTWPVFDSERAITLFILSMQIVLLPKALSWISAMINVKRCFRYGGPLLLTTSVLVEILLSALFAPVMMVAQSRMVWEIITGQDSGWKPQRRNDGSIPFTTALRTHIWHMLLGVSAAVLTYFLQHDLFYWLLPVTSGLMLSAVLSWVSGKRLPGRILQILGILKTPEEHREPAINTSVLSNLAASKTYPLSTPLDTLLNDSDLRAWHCAQIRPLRMHHGIFDAELILARAKSERTDSLNTLENWLTPGETLAFLHSPELIEDVTHKYFVKNDADEMTPRVIVRPALEATARDSRATAL